MLWTGPSWPNKVESEETEQMNTRREPIRRGEGRGYTRREPIRRGEGRGYTCREPIRRGEGTLVLIVRALNLFILIDGVNTLAPPACAGYTLQRAVRDGNRTGRGRARQVLHASVPSYASNGVPKSGTFCGWHQGSVHVQQLLLHAPHVPIHG